MGRALRQKSIGVDALQLPTRPKIFGSSHSYWAAQKHLKSLE